MSSFLYANIFHFPTSDLHLEKCTCCKCWLHICDSEKVWKPNLSNIFIILRLMQKITTLALTLLWWYIPGFVLSYISFYLCYLQDTDIISALSNSSKLNTGHPNWRMRRGWLDKLTPTGRGLSYSPSAGWQNFAERKKRRCFCAYYQTLDSFVWIWSKENCLAFSAQQKLYKTRQSRQICVRA